MGADLDPAGFDGLILPGGHAPGMRQYLGSPVLSEQVGRLWRLNRPVGAICHGVLVLARTCDPDTGRSVLADRRTTCLPKYMERSAYLSTAWRLGRYYRTYPAYVEDEVRAALADPDRQFEHGPVTLSARGTAADDRPAFVVSRPQLRIGPLARRRVPVRSGLPRPARIRRIFIPNGPVYPPTVRFVPSRGGRGASGTRASPHPHLVWRFLPRAASSLPAYSGIYAIIWLAM